MQVGWVIAKNTCTIIKTSSHYHNEVWTIRIRFKGSVIAHETVFAATLLQRNVDESIARQVAEYTLNAGT